MMKKLTPVLRVPDVARTMAFYEKNFGFKRIAAVPETAPFVFAMGEIDGIEVMFQEKDSLVEDMPSLKNAPLGLNVALYFEVAGIDELHARLEGKVDIVKKLHETFYGTREFYVKDCDGGLIGFAEKR